MPRATIVTWATIARSECNHERDVEHTHQASNENKMSDGGRGRASLGVEVWKSSQMWSAQRSAVRSIAWLDAFESHAREKLV